MDAREFDTSTIAELVHDRVLEIRSTVGSHRNSHRGYDYTNADGQCVVRTHVEDCTLKVSTFDGWILTSSSTFNGTDGRLVGTLVSDMISAALR